jgi:hypothetical protein
MKLLFAAEFFIFDLAKKICYVSWQQCARLSLLWVPEFLLLNLVRVIPCLKPFTKLLDYQQYDDEMSQKLQLGKPL